MPKACRKQFRQEFAALLRPEPRNIIRLEAFRGKAEPSGPVWSLCFWRLRPYRGRHGFGLCLHRRGRRQGGDAGRDNHGKFAASPEIVQLIGQRLIMGQTLTDSTVTLNQCITAVVVGTVTSIGDVAATTVAAPAATM